MRKALDLRNDKRISTDFFIKLAEYVLKKKIFEHSLSPCKQLRDTVISTKMAQPDTVIVLVDY